MKACSGFLKVATTIVILLILAAAISANDGEYSRAKGTGLSLGSVASNSFGLGATDQSSRGSAASSVNLYTGQHVESFPLLSLAGRGGLGVSLSLSYSGNMNAVAKKENRVAQSSPFGLGFSIGRIYIMSDHKNTSDIYDDEYTLFMGGSPIPLKAVDDTLYMTENGTPWIITRSIDKSGVMDQVVGWIILLEDGAVYRLGDCDSSPTNWNATRNVLRFGEYVGNGRSDDDIPHACAWDLKFVHDADSLNWISFEYQHDQRWLRVYDSSGDSVTNSQNSYTGSSYIKAIRTADSSLVEFIYSPRTDRQSFFRGYQYEYYSDSRIAALHVRDKDSTLISSIDFTFSYLNSTADSVLKKLVVDEIVLMSSDGQSSMTLYDFDYFGDTSDASFGAIKSIEFSSGARKEFSYATIDTNANFAELDNSLSVQSDHWSRLNASDNMFMVQDTGGVWTVGIFDGYWNTTTFDASSEEYDFGILSPDGWAAVPTDNDSIIITRWSNGYWETVTIATGSARDTDEYYFLYPGDDCFLLVRGEYREAYGSSRKSRMFRRIDYFNWDGENWDRHYIDSTTGSYILSGAVLRNEMFCATVWADSDQNYFDGWVTMLYGRYDEATDTMHKGSRGADEENYNRGADLFAGHNYVGYRGYVCAHVVQWDGSSWDWGCFSVAASTESFGLAWLPNGIALSGGYSQGHSAVLRTLIPDGSGASTFANFYEEFLPIDDPWGFDVLCASNSFIIGRNEDSENFYKLEWSGRSWMGPTEVFNTNGDGNKMNVVVRDDCFVIGPQRKADNYPTTLKARRYLGNGYWSSVTTVTVEGSSDDGFSASSGYFVCNSGDTIRCYSYDPFYYGADYSSSPVISLATSRQAKMISYPDNFFVQDLTSISSGEYSSTVYAHKFFDTGFSGKASYTVVDSVKLFDHAADESPTITVFDFWGGILDRGAKTPRFARAKVSTPFFAGETPDGYSLHFYYNDVDSTDFYNNDIFDSVPRRFLNLKDADRFGMDNGGFYLDGVEYLSYSYSVGDLATKKQDSSISYYSVHEPPNAPVDVYRVRLDSVHTRQDSLTTDVQYVYASSDRNGQPVKTKQRHKYSNYYLVDSVEYAFTATGYESMSTENAITQVRSRVSYIDSAGTIDALSVSQSDWERHGSWTPVRSYRLRDVSDTSSKVHASDILPSDASFDVYGNLVTSIDAKGDTSGVKLDPEGRRVLATIHGGPPHSCAFFDAEYPFDGSGRSHDGWRKYAEPYCYLSDSAVFTGRKGLRIWDNPNSYSYTMALSRVFHAASLARDAYLLDYWSLTNGVADGIVWQYSGGSSSAVLVDSVSAEGDAQNWQHQRMPIDISEIANLDSIRVALLLNDSTGAYAYFDDVRFHPVDASISTTVYNTSTGVVLADAGSNNTPVNYEYDGFLRPITTKDFENNNLKEVEYKLSELYEKVLLADTVEHPDLCYPYRSNTIIVPCDLMLDYELSVFNMSIEESSSAQVLKNGVLLDSAYCVVPGGSGACTDTANGSFMVEAGDTVVIKVKGGSENPPLSADWRITALVKYSEAPNYVKTTSYRTGSQSNVSVNYYDGFGKTVQQRVRDTIGGQEVSIVSGVTERDARGRSTKSYLPFHDLLGATGTDDYTMRDSVLIEIRDYYDQDFCPDCDTFVYSENAYASDFKSPLDSSGTPGIYHNIASGHVTKYEKYVDTVNQVLVATKYDPDGIETRAYSDKWGDFSYDCSFWDDAPGGWLRTESHKDLRARTDSLCHEDGSGQVKLRSSTYNDLGQVTSTWKVDYGTIRTLYDDAGNVRLMMNDKRNSENKYVYFKYDGQGRKIEEGLVSDTTYFVQDSASSRSFPSPAMSPDVKYRWFYDFHVVGNDTLLAPGKLVRVENEDSSYYKNLYYSPENRSDSVIVKLPFTKGGAALKKMVHEYNRDGSLDKLVVYPDRSNSSTSRSFSYEYDAAGRLSTVKKTTADIGDDQHHWAQMAYNADGSIKTQTLGYYHYFLGDSSKTMQVIDYEYDALGRLIGINDTSDVVVGTYGYGSNNDHFGQQLVYNDESQGYFNGRIYQTGDRMSMPGGRTSDDSLTYICNSMGWLEEVLYADTADSRRYVYNALGQRDSLSTGNDRVLSSYLYDDTPGSSKLLRFDGMDQLDTTRCDTMFYDTLGNLIADTSRGLRHLAYDYRNLLTFVDMIPGASGGGIDAESDSDSLRFYYDQTGMRIKKKFNYYYWTMCYPDTGGGIILMMAGGGGGGTGDPEPCVKEDTSEVLYLYDAGVLLATFDEDDDVIELFVNGPTGKIGSYLANGVDDHFYYLKDYLGTTRAVMKGPKTFSPPEVTWFANYHPFGELKAAMGNYPTDYRFTGKEHDAHTTFEFDYFGARYYDSRIGSFASVDKAGQFASGYMYGGNNPTMTVDPDGNFAFGILVPALWGALYSVGPSAAMTLATGGSWGDFGSGVLSGALTGGIAGGLSSAAGKAANSAAFGVLSKSAASAGTSAIMGNGVSLQGVAASALGGLASTKIMGNYSTMSSSSLANMTHESLHMMAAGAWSGVVSSMACNAMAGNPLDQGMGESAFGGGVGGLSGGIWKSTLIGSPRLPDFSTTTQLYTGARSFGATSDPVYRSGGIWGALAGAGLLPRGYAGFGRDIIVNEIAGTSDPIKLYNEYLWIHETAHFWQYERDGYGVGINRLAKEQLRAFAARLLSFDVTFTIDGQGFTWRGLTPYDPYLDHGAMEWEANTIYSRLRTYY